jgi:hypothetical protein
MYMGMVLIGTSYDSDGTEFPTGDFSYDIFSLLKDLPRGPHTIHFFVVLSSELDEFQVMSNFVTATCTIVRPVAVLSIQSSASILRLPGPSIPSVQVPLAIELSAGHKGIGRLNLEISVDSIQ